MTTRSNEQSTANYIPIFIVDNHIYIQKISLLNGMETVSAVRINKRYLPSVMGVKASTCREMNEKVEQMLSEAPYFDSWINAPAHGENYRSVIRSHMESIREHKYYNLYHPISHIPKAGDFPHTRNMILNIFGEQKCSLGFDYIKLLWENPTQNLPILYLSSCLKGTGKSTFCKWIKNILQQNVTSRNSTVRFSRFSKIEDAVSLVTILEDFIINENSIEDLKVRTSQRIASINEKYETEYKLDTFTKFILREYRHVETLVGIDDLNVWNLRSFDPIEEPIANFLELVTAEIPAFLHWLTTVYKLSTEKKSRTWFSPDLIS